MHLTKTCLIRDRVLWLELHCNPMDKHPTAGVCENVENDGSSQWWIRANINDNDHRPYWSALPKINNLKDGVYELGEFPGVRELLWTAKYDGTAWTETLKVEYVGPTEEPVVVPDVIVVGEALGDTRDPEPGEEDG